MSGYELVRVSQEILDQLLSDPSEPVVLAGIERHDDGTCELVFHAVPLADWFARLLRAATSLVEDINAHGQPRLHAHAIRAVEDAAASSLPYQAHQLAKPPGTSTAPRFFGVEGHWEPCPTCGAPGGVSCSRCDVQDEA